MKRLSTALIVAAFGVALAVPAAFAQSSGSFNYGSSEGQFTACVLNNNNTGSISGGVACGPQTSSGGACTTNADCQSGESCVGAAACTTDAQCPSGDTCDTTNGADVCVNTGECGVTCSGADCGNGCVGSVTVPIKTSSGSGNVFVVRPSAVVGLLTDVTVSSKQVSSASGSTSSSALAGVDFQVNVTSGPNSPSVTPSGNVTYDARFIQISTNLFQALSTQCTSISGGCFFTFNESTVSAHSFDWVVGGTSPLQSGTYDLTASWKSSLGDFGISESMTCVGPVNVTVEQNKIFAPSAKTSSTVNF